MGTARAAAVIFCHLEHEIVVSTPEGIPACRNITAQTVPLKIVPLNAAVVELISPEDRVLGEAEVEADAAPRPGGYGDVLGDEANLSWT